MPKFEQGTCEGVSLFGGPPSKPLTDTSHYFT